MIGLSIFIGIILLLIGIGGRFRDKLFTPPSNRLQIKDVKVGEYIRIEWSKIEGGLGYLKCLNNDPKTQKIFLEIRWGNWKKVGCAEYEQIILDYKSDQLKNFHLLNSTVEEKRERDKEEEETDIAALQKRMNEALEHEEYEKADELQKKINKLLKK